MKRLKMASGGVLVTLDCEIRWRDLSEEVRCKVDGWEGGYVFARQG